MVGLWQDWDQWYTDKHLADGFVMGKKSPNM